MNSKVLFSAAAKAYQMGHYTQSLATLNTLVDIQQDGKTYALLAKTLDKLGFALDSARAYEVAGRFDGPNKTEYLRQAIKLYFTLGMEDQALLHGMRLLPTCHDDPEIAFVLSAIFLKRQRTDITRIFKKTLANSSNPEHVRMASLLLTDDLTDETNFHLARTLYKRYPSREAFLLLYLVFLREYCDYDQIEKYQTTIDKEIAQGNTDIIVKDNPFYNLHWCGDESINTRATWALPAVPDGARARRRKKPHAWGEKIRIGYLSSDLWSGHATMKLLQRVLELHDTDRFEVVLFDHTLAEHLEHNKVDRSRWGKIVEIGEMSNEAAAKLVQEHNIDILVDLKGHTGHNRCQILNHETAPVHVAWLGFPGSTLNIDLDYIVGDRFVLPEASKAYYHEKFCRLPDTYQPNDPLHRPKPAPVTRAELGLPDDAFVFASFNGNRKITAKTVEIWSNILNRTENSVLWLMCTSARNEEGLLKRFKANGVNLKRIILCPRAHYEAHISRQQAADLGLDTFPVNGHTTTSEQLWGGLPVLTVKGTHFASRVSESLLNAIGLPELVTADLQAYEDMAVELCNSRHRVEGFKQTIDDNKFIKPLFDAERFCNHLETAYEMMVDRAKQGIEPDHFDVPALPERTEPFHAIVAE